MHVLIAGGGIGGLTAAIALRHQGIDAFVLEQAKVLTEIGAGIQIAANAAIVLRELGLENAMRAVGVKPQSYDYRDLRTGKMLYQAPLGDEAAGRYGAPMYNVHRADLIQILWDAIPQEPKRFGAALSTCRRMPTPSRSSYRMATACAAMYWSAATASIQ
jgi:salicylate hydroxylase